MKSIRRAIRGIGRRGFQEYVERIVAPLDLSKAEILSIGSGGQVEALVRGSLPEDARLITSDIDPERGPDIVDDVTRSDLESDRFDLIFILEVLEHVKEPQAAIVELYRILKPGGTLALSTPFQLGLHDRPYDFYRYTKYGLQYLLSDFDEVDIREQNGWMEALLVLLLRVARRGGLSLVLVPVVVLLYPIARLVTATDDYDELTTTYFVRAVKPAGKG